MTGFSPMKKFFLSVTFAFLLLLYVPLACVVGNDLSQEVEQAYAETAVTYESEEICEKNDAFAEENVSFDE